MENKNLDRTGHQTMSKGSRLFGGKSGVLPEVRQIFKKPIKPVMRPANANTGYAEGVEHPKGSSREQPLPEVRSVGDLIKDTVKDPRSIPNLNVLNEQQKDKVTKAALRRQYYADSLKKEEKRLSYVEKKQLETEEQDRRIKEETKYEMSESTKLTLPTISKLLEGPLMRQRTEEETQILDAKRQANRLQNELRGKENRATDLLEVYYAAESFITTEADLMAKINDVFGDGAKHSVNQMTILQRDINPQLLDSLFGQIKKRPALVEVEELITGERLEFQEKVDELSRPVIEEQKNAALNGLQKN